MRTDEVTGSDLHEPTMAALKRALKVSPEVLAEVALEWAYQAGYDAGWRDALAGMPPRKRRRLKAAFLEREA